MELTAEESHHLLRVLRLGPGARIELFDTAALSYLAEVVDGREGIARVRLLETLATPAPAGSVLNLAISVIKRRAMDWMIEKLSELGVDSVQMLLAARSIGAGDFKGEPPERWARLAIAAAKQCGRNRPLSVASPAPLSQWLGQLAGPAHKMVAQPEGEIDIARSLAQRPDPALPIWVVIGPEGGWTPTEQEAFLKAGFQPVRLGELTLRAETAALAAAALCRLA